MTVKVEKAGVIGTGQMGRGIVHTAALFGIEVTWAGRNQKLLDAGLQDIAVRMERQIAKGQITEEQKQKALDGIKLTQNYEPFRSCDLVIEAVVEDKQVKEQVFANLLPYLAPEALLATNTSSLSVTEMATKTDRPDKFIGMHFMNPVPLMQLVEIVRGAATSEETYQATLALAGKMGKVTATAHDYPGFIVNRLLIPMLNEAVFALQEGVGDVRSIDTAMKLGANHPMGPLELADLIGLDTCLSIMRVLYEGLSDSKYGPCPLLTKYVQAGWLGRKTKRGFYDYSVNPPVPAVS